MAYHSNLTQETIGIIQLTEFTDIRVDTLRDSNEDLVDVDIRSWYNTKSDPTKKPSTKGVRFTKAQCKELLVYLKSIESELD